MGRRTGEGVRQLAVIGHHQQPFAVIIEPAYGEHTQLNARKEMHHCGPSLWIADGGDKLLRLVQHVVTVFDCWVDQLAIDTDVIVDGIGFAAQLGDNLSVYLDAALQDEFFCLAARCDPGAGKDFLQTLGFSVWARCCSVFAL